MTLPSVETELALFGLLIHIEFKPQSVMLLLAAGLAAAGSEWLIKGEAHPPSRSPAAEHWLIPSFAAIAIGFIVMRIPNGPPLWLGLVMGASLLVAVLTAEFIVALEGDPRHDNVTIALKGLAFLLMTGSFFAIYDSQLRAFFTIPFVFAISSLISWRLLRLSVPDLPIWTWAALSGLISAQFAIGLHYLPLSPLMTSVLLGVLSYIGDGFILTHMERRITWRDVVESVVIMLISLIVLVSID